MTPEHQQRITNDEATKTEKPTKGGLASLFEGMSGSQLIAGALAAATSLLLSSYIGIAGSVVGAAIAYVVSAVASQLYKKMLSASADKIRDVVPGASSSTSVMSETEQLEIRGATSDAQEQKTVVFDERAVAQAQATRAINANDVRYRAYETTSGGKDPAVLRAHERRNRKSRVKRQVVVVSVISALVAIGITAGLIHVATAGAGLGAKTEPLFPTTTNVQDEKATTTEHPSSSDEQSSSSSTDNNQSAGSDSNTSTNGSASTSGSSSGSSNSGSSSGTSGSSGSSSSGNQSGSSSGQGGSGSQSGSGSSSGSGSGSGSGSSSNSSHANVDPSTAGASSSTE